MPAQCRNCLRFGHSSTMCRARQQCVNCSRFHDRSVCPNSQTRLCALCGGPHGANYGGCPEFKKAKQRRVEAFFGPSHNNTNRQPLQNKTPPTTTPFPRLPQPSTSIATQPLPPKRLTPTIYVEAPIPTSNPWSVLCAPENPTRAHDMTSFAFAVSPPPKPHCNQLQANRYIPRIIPTNPKSKKNNRKRRSQLPLEEEATEIAVVPTPSVKPSPFPKLPKNTNTPPQHKDIPTHTQSAAQVPKRLVPPPSSAAPITTLLASLLPEPLQFLLDFVPQLLAIYAAIKPFLHLLKPILSLLSSSLANINTNAAQ